MNAALIHQWLLANGHPTIDGVRVVNGQPEAFRDATGVDAVATAAARAYVPSRADKLARASDRDVLLLASNPLDLEAQDELAQRRAAAEGRL